MQTLQIIVGILGIVSYAATTAFTYFAFNRLRTQQSHIRTIEMMLGKMMIVTMSEHLKSSFDNLNEMKKHLHELVDEERFEEAEDLKKAIIKAESLAFDELERFKKDFGEDCVEVRMIKIKRN